MESSKLIKRILLINPPAIVKKSWSNKVGSFPLGLSYIAAVLLEKNYKVQILDCFIEGMTSQKEIGNNLIRVGLTDEEITEKIQSFSPDLVGVSIQFSCQYNAAMQIGRLVKKIDKNIFTMTGGNHVSAVPESIHNGVFNYTIIGEGEYRILNLVEAINNNTHQEKTILSDKGFIHNLDALPNAAYHLLPLEKYWGSNGSKRWINMIATRGCPFNCVFCSIKTVMGKRVRYRSVNHVIDEIVLLKKNFKIDQIYFEDDNFTFKIDWAKEFFQKLINQKIKLEIYFRNGIRADRVDLELLKLMKKAGVKRVWFAPESGSQHTLNKIIKKNMKLEDVENSVKLARKVGLAVTCFLVIGLPEETKEDIEQTIQYGHKLKKLGCDRIWLSCAVPYPGTELFDNCVKQGIIKGDAIDYQSLSTMESVISNQWLTAYEIKRIRDEAMEELNKTAPSSKLTKIKAYMFHAARQPSTILKKIRASI